ncbi:hypothetical protein BT93_K2321 [Corymbia citriodora subsp. variegata]|nr:hypothetical protein BT93_K2321 [Corymbia citriodora subsp. variegata]
MMLLKCTQAVCRYARERCFSIGITVGGFKCESPRVQIFEIAAMNPVHMGALEH